MIISALPVKNLVIHALSKADADPTGAQTNPSTYRTIFFRLKTIAPEITVGMTIGSGVPSAIWPGTPKTTHINGVVMMAANTK
jgi:hypothetical protein